MKIGFGIVGCGHIGNRHAFHLQNHYKSRLVACTDIVKEKAVRFSSGHNCVPIDGYDEFLKNQNIDVVNICTPNGTHAELSVQALKAGKHVLVEKPMALSVDDCKKMMRAAKRANRSLFVVKQNRFNPPIQWVKTNLDKQNFGRLLQVSVNCFWNRNEAYYKQAPWRGTKAQDGGILFTQFSHFVDILYYLCGAVKHVCGYSNNYIHPYNQIEDGAHFSFALKNGAIGSLSATVNSYGQNLEGSITLFFERATLKIGGKYLNTLEFLKSERMDKLPKIPAAAANDYGEYEGSMSNHDKVIDNVIKTLKGEEQIMTSAEEGTKVVGIIEQFYKAIGQ